MDKLNIPSVEGYLDVLYNAFSKAYNNKGDIWTTEEVMKRVCERALQHLTPQKSIDILDIGCGPGRDVEYLAAQNHRVTGLDIVAHDIKWKQLAQRFENVNFVISDFLKWKNNDVFDLIVDNGCFHHQHPTLYGDYLTHVKTHLNKEGRYVLNVYLDEDRIDIDDDNRLHRYFSLEQLSLLITSSGLQVYENFSILRHLEPGYYLVLIVGHP